MIDVSYTPNINFIFSHLSFQTFAEQTLGRASIIIVLAIAVGGGSFNSGTLVSAR